MKCKKEVFLSIYSYQILHFVMHFEEFEKLNLYITGFHME